MDDEDIPKKIGELSQEKYFYFLYFLRMEELYEKYKYKYISKLDDVLIPINRNNKEEN